VTLSAWRGLTVVAALMLSVSLAAPARGALLPDGERPACVGPDGRYAVIEEGREDDLLALIAPAKMGQPLPTGAGAEPSHGLPRPIVSGLTIQGNRFRVLVTTAERSGALVVRDARCAPGDSANSRSFHYELDAPDEPALTAALEDLRAYITANDDGTFWRVYAKGAEGVRSNGAAITSSEEGFVLESSVPLLRSTLAIAVLLLLATLALVLDLPFALRDAGLVGRGRWREGARVLGALAALTAVALALRWLAQPTFLREAYPYPNVAWLSGPQVLRGGIDAYPQGDSLLIAGLRWLWPGDPFAAVFGTHVILGALTIPAAFAAGLALSGRRSVALASALLVCFWPQHIRVSASEVAHVPFLLGTALTLAAAARAATSGRLTAYVAALTTAAATFMTRPEAGFVGPAFALVLLGHGPGVRRALLRPHLGTVARWAVAAALAAVVLPTAWMIVQDGAANSFAPGSSGSESLGGWASLHALSLFLRPDGLNGLFDVATSPVWLWPLSLWGAIVAWRDRRRVVVLALLGTIYLYFWLYAGMPPSLVLWKLGRYHASALIPAAVLAAFGLVDAVERATAWVSAHGKAGAAWLRPRSASRLRDVAVAVVAGLGAVLWWGPVDALPQFRWQRGLMWPVELGRAHPEILGPGERLVVPDNRRLFADLSPRMPIFALSRGRQDLGNAVPIPHALAKLWTEGDHTPALYFEGLHCYLAVAPGEDRAPECDAMHRTFDLEPVATLDLDAPPLLVAYLDVRPPGPIRLGLYRVRGRRLGAQEALDLLPPLGDPRALPFPMGHNPQAWDEPPEPPLGAPVPDARGW